MNRTELEALGQSLRPINPRFLRKESGDTTRVWYQGGEPYFDIFVDLHDGEIAWFQATLRGRFLCWRCNGAGWQTGMTNELLVENSAAYPASKLVALDDNLDREFVQCVQTLLAARADDPLLSRLADFCAQACWQAS